MHLCTLCNLNLTYTNIILWENSFSCQNEGIFIVLQLMNGIRGIILCAGRRGRETPIQRWFSLTIICEFNKFEIAPRHLESYMYFDQKSNLAVKNKHASTILSLFFWFFFEYQHFDVLTSKVANSGKQILDSWILVFFISHVFSRCIWKILMTFAACT